MSKVTADTITVAQIRQLYHDSKDADVVRSAVVALYTHSAGGVLAGEPTDPHRRDAVERCADAWNRLYGDAP